LFVTITVPLLGVLYRNVLPIDAVIYWDLKESYSLLTTGGVKKITQSLWLKTSVEVLLCRVSNLRSSASDKQFHHILLSTQKYFLARYNG